MILVMVLKIKYRVFIFLWFVENSYFCVKLFILEFYFLIILCFVELVLIDVFVI